MQEIAEKELLSMPDEGLKRVVDRGRHTYPRKKE